MSGDSENASRDPVESGVAATLSPPRMRVTAHASMDDYALKRRTLVIRHVSGDRIVALLEIMPPGNNHPGTRSVRSLQRPSRPFIAGIIA